MRHVSDPFAFQERWEAAVLMVAVAGVLDALDGRMARILKVSSNLAPSSTAFRHGGFWRCAVDHALSLGA